MEGKEGLERAGKGKGRGESRGGDGCVEWSGVEWSLGGGGRVRLGKAEIRTVK